MYRKLFISNPQKFFLLIFVFSSLFIFYILSFVSMAHASVVLDHSNNATLSSGLIGYWSFDGPATNWTTGTTQDMSGNGNTGQMIGMSTSSSPVAGKIGQALKFNGASSNISVATNLGGGVWSVSAWIKLPSSANIVQVIYAQNDNIFYVQSNNTLKFQGGTAIGFPTITSTATLKPNVWYHVVATHAGAGSGQTKLYVNGLQGDDASAIANLISAGADFIGRQTLQSTRYFNGTIDDGRIYNRVLNVQEVQQLYALGSTNVAHSNTVTLTSGLVGYWTLDGSKTNWATGQTLDSSGNGNTGQMIGMSTSTSPVAGKIGEALKFNGTSSYIPATVSLSANVATGCAWIKSSNVANSQRIFAQGTSGDASGNNFSLQIISSTIRGIVGNGGGGQFVGTGVSINSNIWYHVCMVLGGGSLKLYINGSLAQTDTTSTTLATGSLGMAIGRTDNGSGVQYFQGILDDVRIYSRALSAQEVQQLYALGAANTAHSNTDTLTSGLVGYWPLDGGTTSWNTDTTKDMSGNGNTGSLISMSTSSSPVAGKIGQALKFNGTSQAISTPIIAGTSKIITVSFWLNSKYNADTPAIESSPNSNLNNGATQFSPEDKSSGSACQNVGPSFVIQDTGYKQVCVPTPSAGWHYWAVVYDNSTVAGNITVFEDGATKTTTSGVHTKTGTSNLLGTYQWYLMGRDASSVFTNGTLDDVRIYNRALSTREVQQLYLLGK
jgi:hypothetical protein